MLSYEINQLKQPKAMYVINNFSWQSFTLLPRLWRTVWQAEK